MQTPNTPSEPSPTLFIPFPQTAVQSEANDSLNAKVVEANAALQKSFITKESTKTMLEQVNVDKQRIYLEKLQKETARDQEMEQAVFPQRLATAKAEETRKFLETSKNNALLKEKEQEALWTAERAAQRLAAEKAEIERRAALTQVREQSEHAVRVKEFAFDAQLREENSRIELKKRQINLDTTSDFERMGAEKAAKLLKVKRYRFALTQAHEEQDAQYQLALSKLKREEEEIIATTKFEQDEMVIQATLKAFGGAEKK